MADVSPTAYLPKDVDWREMLRDYPPGTRGSVRDAVQRSDIGTPQIAAPELQLFCGNCSQEPSYCRGSVRAVGRFFPGPSTAMDAILAYQCRRCEAEVRSYAVRIITPDLPVKDIRTVDAAKLAEWPSFSPPTPSKLNSLIGPDRELFFKGRASESQGLGVGAFAYYRRIVEDQKRRLLDAIIEVARRTNVSTETINLLERAKSETQFSRAVDMVRDAVPPTLFIKGRNPLTILHAALSRNLHGASDAECLKDAHAVRVVLCEFAEKLGEALKDQRELDEAINRLQTPPA
jgi:hypothetical protein